MTRELQSLTRKRYQHLQNFSAALVAGGALAFVYYSYQPAKAEDSSGETTRVSRLSDELPDTRVRVVSPAEKSESIPNPGDLDDSAVGDDNPQRAAIVASIHQLQKGIAQLESCPCYSTVFERVERIDGELKDEQQIELKLRHSPFSVYMKWLNGDKGRELLYTDNENEGRMLVKLGGFKGRLIPTLRLDPLGSQAMSETRHPVTRAGLVNLAKELIEHRQRDLESGHYPQCIIEEGHTFDGRSCTKVIVEYDSSKRSPLYRKSVTMIDDQLALPVYVRNYTWPNQYTTDLEQDTLVECYAYKNIKIEKQVADAVWEVENPDYRFKR